MCFGVVLVLVIGGEEMSCENEMGCGEEMRMSIGRMKCVAS